jgi:hypothetical protein
MDDIGEFILHAERLGFASGNYNTFCSSPKLLTALWPILPPTLTSQRRLSSGYTGKDMKLRILFHLVMTL